ncbi:MAG: hypothetical protein GXP58_09705 [Deltaproteobacteria bacterium]|nr:hypothetical protein [Deltaproteobacteria bacterium]
MGVISVRLNKKEEKILKKLTEHFETDKSALIKKSLLELYENLVDLEFIEEFERKEQKGEVSFVPAGEILKD